MAIGQEADVSDQGVSIGYAANALLTGVAIGTFSDSIGGFCVAIGPPEHGSILGGRSTKADYHNTCIGAGAQSLDANCYLAEAIGAGSTVGGLMSQAFGFMSYTYDLTITVLR